MIQRIQTLYLLIALGLLVAVNFFPLVTVTFGAASTCVVSSTGVTEIPDSTFWTWGLVGFSALAALLALVAIISYGNRRRQMSLCTYGILACVGFYACLGIQAWVINSAYQNVSFMPELAGQLPLIAVVFFILAGRAIKRDEALVRSVDRIR